LGKNGKGKANEFPPPFLPFLPWFRSKKPPGMAGGGDNRHSVLAQSLPLKMQTDQIIDIWHDNPDGDMFGHMSIRTNEGKWMEIREGMLEWYNKMYTNWSREFYNKNT
jgi:hypothetical protein